MENEDSSVENDDFGATRKRKLTALGRRIKSLSQRLRLRLSLRRWLIRRSGSSTRASSQVRMNLTVCGIKSTI